MPSLGGSRNTWNNLSTNRAPGKLECRISFIVQGRSRGEGVREKFLSRAHVGTSLIRRTIEDELIANEPDASCLKDSGAR